MRMMQDRQTKEGFRGGEAQQTVDDVGGGASAARFSNFANGFVRVGGVVLGDEADEEAGPQTAGDAGEHVAVVEDGGDRRDAGGAADGEGDGAGREEGLANHVHDGGVEHGGDGELHAGLTLECTMGVNA
jgi:hypothetical protein